STLAATDRKGSAGAADEASPRSPASPPVARADPRATLTPRGNLHLQSRVLHRSGRLRCPLRLRPRAAVQGDIGGAADSRRETDFGDAGGEPLANIQPVGAATSAIPARVARLIEPGRSSSTSY